MANGPEAMLTHPAWFYLFWAAVGLMFLSLWSNERAREIDRAKAVENYDWGFDKSMKLIDECRLSLKECHEFAHSCMSMPLYDDH